MEVGMSSCFFNILNPFEMVKTIKECGFSHIEIDENHSRYLVDGEINVDEFKCFTDDIGISVKQGHLPFTNPSFDDVYFTDKLKRYLDVFYKLGVKAAVLHYSSFGPDVLPLMECFEYQVKALNVLTDYIKDTDMSICLENLSRVYDYDAGYLLKLCKAIDNDKNIGICLDTGHLNISRRGNQYDFIMQSGEYLKAMHVHDNRGEQYGLEGLPCDWHTMPFAGGNINWENVKRGVKDLGYHGLFCFEVGSSAPLEIRKIQAKYLLEMYNMYFKF